MIIERGSFLRAGRARHRRSVARALVEALEPRQLMTVDLSGSFLVAPTAVLSGTKQAIEINVANSGDTKASGRLTVSFYAALEGETFNAGTAALVGTYGWDVSIAGGGSKVLRKSSIPISAALVAGAYRLYAVIDTKSKFVETDEGNNTAQSAVMAVAQPDYNLMVACDSAVALVPAVIEGQNTNAKVKVRVCNSTGATAATPSGVSVLVQIVARPTGAADDSQDVLLNTARVSMGGKAPGKTVTASIAIRFPATLTVGSYEVIAKLDTGCALAETIESDNEAVYEHDVEVATPFCDLTLGIDGSTVIPPGVVADGRALPLKFNVQNLGNAKVAGQSTFITVYAYNMDEGTDHPLQVFPVSVTGLAPGAVKKFTLSPGISPVLPDGTYQLRAVLTTSAAGDASGNNTATVSSTMEIGPAYYNLAALTPTSTYNPAVVNGLVVGGVVTVPVKNLSNTLIPQGAQVTVNALLRPTGAIAGGTDIPIGSLTTTALGTLASGATRLVNVNTAIPATLPNGDPIPSGDYQLVATLAPIAMSETTTADNTAAGSTITIAAPFGDLAVVSATQNYTTPAARGSTATGTVVLRNVGNVAIQRNIAIQFRGQPEDAMVATELGNATFLISLQPGQTSSPLNVALTLNMPNNGLLVTEVPVTVRLDPAVFNDTNSGNSQLAAGTVIMSSQYVDLTFCAATNPFTATGQSGGTGTGHVQIGNIGSGIGVGPVTVSYYASLTNSIDESAILIGSQLTTVNLSQVQISPVVDVELTLPTVTSATAYKILAKITADLALDNNPYNNTTSVLGTVTVQPV